MFRNQLNSAPESEDSFDTDSGSDIDIEEKKDKVMQKQNAHRSITNV